MNRRLIERLQTRAHILETKVYSTYSEFGRQEKLAKLLREAADALEKFEPQSDDDFKNDTYA